MVLIGTGHIMYTVKHQQMGIRHDDIANACVAGSVTIAYFVCVGVFPDWMTNVIDMMLIANLWYTMFLGSVTMSNLSCWPSIINGVPIRMSNTSVIVQVGGPT